MRASPSALNTPQRTSFDVPTPLKIKKAPILGARKKGKAQKNLRPQQEFIIFYQEFENLRIISLVHTAFSNSIILDLKKILSLGLDSFSGEAFFQPSKIEGLFLFWRGWPIPWIGADRRWHADGNARIHRCMPPHSSFGASAPSSSKVFFSFSDQANGIRTAFLAKPFFSSTSSGAFFSSLVLAHHRCAHSFSASQLGELFLIEDWH